MAYDIPLDSPEASGYKSQIEKGEIIRLTRQDYPDGSTEYCAYSVIGIINCERYGGERLYEQQKISDNDTLTHMEYLQNPLANVKSQATSQTSLMDYYLTSWFSSIYSTISNWFNQVYQWTLSLYDSLHARVTGWINQVYAWGQTLINSLRNTVTSWINQVYQWGQAQFITLQNTVVGWINQVYSWGQTQINVASNEWSAKLTQLDSWFQTQLAQINEAFGWINNFRDSVEDFFTDPEQWLYDRLDSFFERFW